MYSSEFLALCSARDEIMGWGAAADMFVRVPAYSFFRAPDEGLYNA